MAIDLLSIQPHKVSRDLSGYITYIFGEAKIGKTSLAAQAKDCLLLATERGYNALSGIYAIDITSWRDMKEAYRELKKPEVQERYKVLIVDTIDLAAKYCTKYICNQNGITDLSELKWGKGYSLMRSEFEDMFNSLTQMGYAIIFISHVKRIIDEDTGKVTVGPSLAPDKVNDIIRNMADIYGWAHYSNDEEHSGERILTIRTDSDDISCGTRFKYMKPEIPFSYNSLVKALQEAIDEEEKQNGKEAVTDEPIKPVKSDMGNFNEVMANIRSMISKIQMNVPKEEFNKTWKHTITEITDKYLGAGKKVSDCTPAQIEQLSLIASDLTDVIGNFDFSIYDK